VHQVARRSTWGTLSCMLSCELGDEAPMVARCCPTREMKSRTRSPVLKAGHLRPRRAEQIRFASHEACRGRRPLPSTRSSQR
jgi:hypothetical protein